MNELMIFNHPEFGVIRTIEENGKVLFCAKDVAAALGYKNTRDAINRHCKGVVKRDGVSRTTNQHGMTTEQTVEMAFIPEGDIYRLAAKSELPGAERFESWIFDEVLPSIRRNGGYIANQDELSPEELMANVFFRFDKPRLRWRISASITIFTKSSLRCDAKETISRRFCRTNSSRITVRMECVCPHTSRLFR